MDLTKVRHPSLLEGMPGEFASDPVVVNRQLYRGPHDEWLVVHETDQVLVEAANPPIDAWGRWMITVRFTFKNGDVLLHPFYRSTGRATPGQSPKGTWWPCCGLYTEEYCRLRGHSREAVGYIGKHYQDCRGNWKSHHKDLKRLPSALRLVREKLAGK